MRTLRLFSLLDHLRGARDPIPAESLARILDVSVRTIYRDMASLQAMGAPVRGEAGIGYRIEKGYFLPPLRFDPDELEAVMLGMRLVAARGDADLADAAERVSAKIGAVLEGDQGELYAALPLRAVSREGEERRRAAAHLGALRRALRSRTIVALRYLDVEERASERTCRPLGLTVYDAVWLLTAWCELRQDFRNFRLDRIERLELTGVRFRLERGRRFEDYLRTLSDTPR